MVQRIDLFLATNEYGRLKFRHLGNRGRLEHRVRSVSLKKCAKVQSQQIFIHLWKLPLQLLHHITLFERLSNDRHGAVVSSGFCPSPELGESKVHVKRTVFRIKEKHEFSPSSHFVLIPILIVFGKVQLLGLLLGQLTQCLDFLWKEPGHCIFDRPFADIVPGKSLASCCANGRCQSYQVRNREPTQRHQHSRQPCRVWQHAVRAFEDLLIDEVGSEWLG